MIRDTSGQDTVIAPAQGRKKKLIIAAVALAGAVLLTGLALPSYRQWSASELSYPLARLRVGEVSRGAFLRDASVQGKIVAANSPTLYAPSTGTVTLKVQAGDTVKRGDVLAHVDSPELTNELERETASLSGLDTELGRARIDARQKRFDSKRAIDIAKVTLEAADREMRRADDPLLRQALSQLEYEKVKDDLTRAQIEYRNALEQDKLQKDNLDFDIKTKEHQVERQKLVVANLQRQVDELDLRSPVDGMVGTVHVVQKAVVADNAPVITVVDLTAYAAELEVPESYADDLGLGMETDIEVNGKTYKGKISAVSPEVQNNLVNARVAWQDDTPAGLRQNQRISARIIFESRDNVVTLPRGPFLESGGGRIVYVVNGELATRRKVNVGATSVNAVEILDGLKPGERVVLSSTSDFKDAENVLLTE